MYKCLLLGKRWWIGWEYITLRVIILPCTSIPSHHIIYCDTCSAAYAGSLLDLHFIVSGIRSRKERIQAADLMKRISDLFFIGHNYTQVWISAGSGAAKYAGSRKSESCLTTMCAQLSLRYLCTLCDVMKVMFSMRYREFKIFIKSLIFRKMLTTFWTRNHQGER